jgi:hypothetical protein
MPAFVLRENENRKPARRRLYIRLSGFATTLHDLFPSWVRAYDRCRGSDEKQNLLMGRCGQHRAVRFFLNISSPFFSCAHASQKLPGDACGNPIHPSHPSAQILPLRPKPEILCPATCSATGRHSLRNSSPSRDGLRRRFQCCRFRTETRMASSRRYHREKERLKRGDQM